MMSTGDIVDKTDSQSLLNVMKNSKMLESDTEGIHMFEMDNGTTILVIVLVVILVIILLIVCCCCCVCCAMAGAASARQEE